GAWVLWYEQIGMRFPQEGAVDDPPWWRIVQTKRSEAECLRALAAEVREEARATSRSREISATENIVSENIFEVGNVDRRLVAMRTRRYICLPDTVDPRGPKGKRWAASLVAC